MPTYEYACKACDHDFEIVQSFSEDSLTTCPECEQEELRKVYNAAGIIFKGDGWHIKDYGSRKPAASSTGEDSSGSGDASGSEATPSEPKTKKSKKGEQRGSGAGSSAATPAAG